MEPVIETYTVKQGEGFEFIANKLGINYYQLLAANPQIDNVQLIKTGDTIYLPIKETPHNTVYIVQKDDTLMMGIAKKMGVPYLDLLRDNPHIKTPDHILPGYRLRIRTQPQSQPQSQEDSDSPLSICTPTACTEDELIVEIVGKVTNENQRILIYTEQNQYDEGRTEQRKIEQLQDDVYESTLHKWDWNKTDIAHLWLEIAATQGDPIKLPLLAGYEPIKMPDGEILISKSDTSKAKLTPRQRAIHGQLNLIVPFVPMTDLLKYNKLEIEVNPNMATSMPVLCSQGWVYIFKNNKLWREAEIRQSEQTGKTTYHDVRLSDYRKEDPNKIDKKADIRPAVGKALDDIWLPARWNEVAQTWKMFYAPSQLSQARVNHLQQNPQVLNKRSHEITMEVNKIPFGVAMPNATFCYPNKPFLLQSKMGGQVKTAPNHIPRDLGREYLLTNPSNYLVNQSYLENVKSASHVLHTYFGNTPVAEDGTPTYHAQATISKDNTSPARWAYFIKEKMAAITKAVLASEKDKKDPNSAWTKYLRRKEDEDILWTPSTQQPILTPIINKKICGIFLFDPLNQLQHTHQLIGQCREVQALIIDQANLRKNYGSAFLIKSIMLEMGAVDESDERYKAATRMLKNQKAANKFLYALADKDRDYARKLIALYQTYHANLLKNEITVQAIKDTTSGIGLDLLGGNSNLAGLLNDLNSPHSSDQLTTPSELKKIVTRPNLANTLTEPSNPYYNMLFPPKVDLSSMLYPYENPIDEILARGDGLWNPAAIGTLEEVTNEKLQALIKIRQGVNQETEKLTTDQIKLLSSAGLNTVYGQYTAERAVIGIDDTLLITSKILSTIAAHISDIDNLIKQSIENAMKSADADAKLAQDGQTYHREQIAENQKDQERQNQKQQELDKQLAANKSAQSEATRKLESARGREQQLRAQLQTSQEALATEQGKLNQLDRAHFLTIPDEEIRNWTQQDIGGDPLKADLKKIVEQKSQHTAEQHRLWNEGITISQEIENIESQQRPIQTEIGSTRSTRNQQAQQALTELKRQRITTSELAATFSVESMRQVAYGGFFELNLLPEVTPDGAMPIGIDRSIFTQLGQPGNKRGRMFSHAEASVVEYDSQGNKIAEVGFDGNANQDFIRRYSNGNYKIRVVGYFFAANRKTSSWKDNRASLDDVDNKIDDLKAQNQALENSKKPLLESMTETERQQLAAMEAEAKAAQEQINQTDKLYAEQLSDQQNRVTNAQQAIYENEQKITSSENKINELNNKQQLAQSDADTLRTEQQNLALERGKTAQLITEHHSALAEQKRLESACQQERVAIQTELDSITNSRVGTNSLLFKLASSNSRLASLTGLALQRSKATLYGLLDHPLLPTVILYIEGRNLINFITGFDKNLKDRGGARIFVDTLSVAFSLSAAMEGFVSKFHWNKVGYEKWVNNALREAPKILQKIGLKAITWRLLLQGPAVLFAIGQSLWNIWDDIFVYQDWGSLAGNSILLSAALAGIPATAVSISGGTIATLGSGGWFLVIVGLVIIGSVVKSVFSRNQLERWTDFGPFSDSPRYNLADETYAFQTLSNLLANLTAGFEEITTEQLNEVEWKVLTNGAPRPKKLMRLVIVSALADLLEKKSATPIGTVRAEIAGEGKFSYLPSHYFQQKIPGGVALYYDLSQDIDNINRLYGMYSNKAGTLFGGIQGFYKLTMQVLVKDKNHKIWAYPSVPDIYNPSSFNMMKDGQWPVNKTGWENDDKQYWLQQVSSDFQIAEVSRLFEPPTYDLINYEA